MRFGVPDFKLEKWIIDRRVALLEAEGVEFRYGVDVGAATTAPSELRARHDAVVLAIGSRIERGARHPRRRLDGVHPAMEYLYAAQPCGRAAGRPSAAPSG